MTGGTCGEGDAGQRARFLGGLVCRRSTADAMAAFLDEIAEAGYEWTELGPYGYLPTEPTALRQELDRRGLRLAPASPSGRCTPRPP